jgi:hypothetical protein
VTEICEVYGTEIVDVALTIRPHRRSFSGRRPTLWHELTELIDRAARGEAVKTTILDLLVAHERHLNRLKICWSYARERAYERLTGDPQRIEGLRYGCSTVTFLLGSVRCP